ncbi:MAG: HEPN domain-containing protein [Ignisphaera sp.]
MILRKYKEFAKAYFTIAFRDDQRAKRALSLKDCPECFFYSQQSVEKSVKVMLEVKLVFKKKTI